MTDFLSFLLLNLLGSMSPGPDFALVSHTAITGHRKAAYLVILGIMAALTLQVIFCLTGLALLITKYPNRILALQTLGGIYLAYLGISALKKKRVLKNEVFTVCSKRAFAKGFLTNALNAQSAIFFLSVFAQYLTPLTSVAQKTVFGLTIPITAALWYGSVAYVLTHHQILPRILRYQGFLAKMTGVCLLCFSIHVLYQSLIYIMR